MKNCSRTFNIWFSIESSTEGLKAKPFWFFVYFVFLQKTQIWWHNKKRYKEIVEAKRWKDSVMATFSWFFQSIPKTLLIAHKPSKSHSNTLEQMECWPCCPDWRSDAKCKNIEKSDESKIGKRFCAFRNMKPRLISQNLCFLNLTVSLKSTTVSSGKQGRLQSRSYGENWVWLPNWNFWQQ